MLGIRGRGFGNAAVNQMFAELARTFNISKKGMIGVRSAFDVEVGILGNAAKTAFGLVQAVTRYGQELSASEWFEYDKTAGKITMQSDNEWNNMRARAALVTDDKEIARRIGNF